MSRESVARHSKGQERLSYVCSVCASIDSESKGTGAAGCLKHVLSANIDVPCAGHLDREDFLRMSSMTEILSWQLLTVSGKAAGNRLKC